MRLLLAATALMTLPAVAAEPRPDMVLVAEHRVGEIVHVGAGRIAAFEPMDAAAFQRDILAALEARYPGCRRLDHRPSASGMAAQARLLCPNPPPP